MNLAGADPVDAAALAVQETTHGDDAMQLQQEVVEEVDMTG